LLKQDDDDDDDGGGGGGDDDDERGATCTQTLSNVRMSVTVKTSL